MPKPSRRRPQPWLRPIVLFLCLMCMVAWLLTSTGAQAGGGSVDANGGVHLNIHFLFPPTPRDVSRVKEQVQRASRLLCDATEGNMKIAETRLSAGGPDEPAGDVWYYPPGAISRSRSAGSPIHNEAHRIYLRHESIRSDVLVHELSHLIFGLGDQYDEQRRQGGACGIGPAFDSDGLLDERNHTIMQQSGSQRCVLSTGEVTGRGCYDDSDCKSGESCPLPALMSEFAVATNNDPLRGDSVLAADTCPAPRPGDTYRIAGVLGEVADTEVFDGASFVTAKDTAPINIAREYIDEAGIVTGYDADSAHPVWVFAERTGAQAWTLHFAMDGKHLEGEADGALVVFDSVDIVFEAAPSVVVSPAGESSQDHRIVVIADGQLLSDPGYTPPTITIPDLVDVDGMVVGSAVLELGFSELTEVDGASGGDLRKSAITWGSEQQLGICGDTKACEARWNTQTERWEATATTAAALQSGGAGAGTTSDWENIVATVLRDYKLTWTAPTGLPEELPRTSHGCDDPVLFDVAVDGLDQVFLVMDRSGSMSETRTWAGVPMSRMDWAKAGAKGFSELMVGEGVEVGLISFNDSIVANLMLAEVVEDGAGAGTPAREISTLTDAIDALSPDLDTAIGDALGFAGDLLDSASAGGRSQAVLLLSDGDQNAGSLEPEEAAEALRDAGVRVYSVPLGSDVDGERLARIAETTDGRLFDADSPDELPPLYAQNWGALRGESPIWAKVESETAPFGGLEYASHPIPVEVGSLRLNVMLSARGEEDWNPTCELRSPSGVVTIACDDPQVVADDVYRIFRVDLPEPGSWTLEIFAYQQPTQRSYVWAHSDGKGPDCWAGVDDPVLEVAPPGGVKIVAAATSTAPLSDGVLYFLQVEKPDGTKLPSVVMQPNAEKNGAEYRFDQFDSRGQYEVLVTCLAGNEAEFAPGERVDLVEILEEGDPVAFVRQAKTSFFLDDGPPPPPPPGDDDGDCDDDGIPDTADPDGGEDPDGDGVLNWCDTDDDNDDVPDSVDECPLEPETFGEFDPKDPIDGCPVPEPGVALGLMTGIGWLAGLERRRRACATRVAAAPGPPARPAPPRARAAAKARAPGSARR